MTEVPEFDHLLHCVADVDEAVAAYTAAGLPAHSNKPFEGFHNGAWRLDERYIEILTIVDHELFAPSAFGRATVGWMPMINRLIAEGGGGLNFAVNVTDVDVTVRRLREQGHAVEVTAFTFEGVSTSFREAVLTDAPPWAPFFITYDPPREQILAMAPPGRVNRGPHDLSGFVIETPEPSRAAAWLSAVTGIARRDEAAIVPLPGATVHFEPGDADRVTTLLLSEADPPTMTINGLNLRPVAADH